MSTFQVVTNGDLALGYKKNEVRNNIKKLCKYDQAQLDKLFSGLPFIFKTDLDQETADRYKQALDQTGIDCRIEAVTSKIEIDTYGSRARSHHPRDKDELKMKCPKCGESQPKRLTCSFCGVVIKKYVVQQIERTTRIEPPSSIDNSGSVTGPKVLIFLIILTFLAAAVYLGYTPLYNPVP
jgi:hypothetical protein